MKTMKYDVMKGMLGKFKSTFPLESKALFSNEVRYVCKGIDGGVKWEEKVPNTVVNEGLRRLLDVMLAGATQIDPWYVALFEDDYTPTAHDNYDDPGYIECTAYDQATRPTYVDVRSGESATNVASKASFTFNATKTIYGESLVSVNTKGDHAAGANNVLFAASKLAAGRAVISGDSLDITHTISAATS